jgi:hypothetical protein
MKIKFGEFYLYFTYHELLFDLAIASEDREILKIKDISPEDMAELYSTLSNWLVSGMRDIPAEYSHSKADVNNAVQDIESLIDDLIKTKAEYPPNTANKSKSKPEAEVVIYIPDKEILLTDTEQVTNAAGDFMEALGFELEAEEAPIFGSFFKKVKYIFSKTVGNEDLEMLYRKGKKALELKYVELPTAEQTEKLASAAEKMVNSLEKFEEGVVKLGAVLVIKKKINGESRISVVQLSTEMIILLDKKPQLLQSLNTLYELVTGDVKILKNDVIDWTGQEL